MIIQQRSFLSRMFFVLRWNMLNDFKRTITFSLGICQIISKMLSHTMACFRKIVEKAREPKCEVCIDANLFQTERNGKKYWWYQPQKTEKSSWFNVRKIFSEVIKLIYASYGFPSEYAISSYFVNKPFLQNYLTL